MIKSAFGAQVKQLRTEQSMTQEELSQRSGLAIRFLQDIEAGNKQASIKTVFKLADGLGVTPDKLINNLFKDWKKTGKPE
jgi:transcriptional regulator with XRE-family HTH domain